eukprot:4806391-Prymnesium_polylepis.1
MATRCSARAATCVTERASRSPAESVAAAGRSARRRKRGRARRRVEALPGRHEHHQPVEQALVPIRRVAAPPAAPSPLPGGPSASM